MNIKAIIAIILAFGISVGILWAVDTYLFKTPSDIVQNLVKIVTVLIVVSIAAFATKAVVHNQGVSVHIDKP